MNITEPWGSSIRFLEFWTGDRPMGSDALQVLHTAAAMARDAHMGVQRRATGEPYFAHVQRVACTVSRSPECWDDYEAVAAAYLHDTVEDTLVTVDDVTEACGDRVGSLVSVLTSQHDQSRQEYIDRILAIPTATVIKRADLSDNISTLPWSSGRSWRRYLRDMEQLTEAVSG